MKSIHQTDPKEEPCWCGDEAHLLAMCQSCHLRLDHPIHVQRSRETRAKRQGFQELPGFAAEGSEAQPEPDRAERSSPEPLHFGRNEHPETCEVGRGICDPGCPCPGPLVCRVPSPDEAARLASEEPEFVRRTDDGHPRESATLGVGGGEQHAASGGQAPAVHAAGNPGEVAEDPPGHEAGDMDSPDVDRPALPLVAVSDGSQDAQGFALLAGLPLPPGYRLADFGPGIAQGPIAKCEGCGRGTVVYQNGKPRHRGCPKETR